MFSVLHTTCKWHQWNSLTPNNKPISSIFIQTTNTLHACKYEYWLHSMCSGCALIRFTCTPAGPGAPGLPGSPLTPCWGWDGSGVGGCGEIHLCTHISSLTSTHAIVHSHSCVHIIHYYHTRAFIFGYFGQCSTLAWNACIYAVLCTDLLAKF